MNHQLFNDLKAGLARSDSETRKFWAQQIIESGISLHDLLSILHIEGATAQRFMWLMGDVCELNPDWIACELPFLLTLHDQMPFPGMPRSLSKWLLLTNVPEQVEKEAVAQMFKWMEGDKASIACRSFTARTLFSLVKQERIDIVKARQAIKNQSLDDNDAFAYRMRKLLDKL